MENADPSARRDLSVHRSPVPENDPHFTHIYEGADDMPSHIKMALTRTVEVIPFANGRLCLGSWLPRNVLRVIYMICSDRVNRASSAYRCRDRSYERQSIVLSR